MIDHSGERAQGGARAGDARAARLCEFVRVVTLHRPSNVDEPGRLGELVGLLERLGEHLGVVFPVHPRTRGRLEEFGLFGRLESAAGVSLLGPLGYRESLGLMAEATVVITDSGGIQEETAFLAVPV